jgi:hypothetical protein
MVELALAKKQYVAASGEKGLDAAKQAGDVRRRFVGRERSSREAEKASGRRLCFAQVIAKLLNAGSQQSRVDLRVSGIQVAKVTGRKHDGFLVESLAWGNVGALGSKKYSFSESCRYQVGQEGMTVPSLEWGPRRSM